MHHDLNELRSRAIALAEASRDPLVSRLYTSAADLALYATHRFRGHEQKLRHAVAATESLMSAAMAVAVVEEEAL